MHRSLHKAMLTAIAGLLATTGATALSASETPHYVTYRIKAHDTLYDLAEDYFTGQRAVPVVQRLNRIANPRRLRIGSRIRIPRSLLRMRVEPLRVASFSGPVEIGDGTAPSVGLTLSEGTRIRTGRGGFITLSSHDGSTVSLPSNSQALLLRSRRILLTDALDVDFKVLEGRGSATVNKVKEGGSFKLQTPAAVSAVRGTEFRVSFDPASQQGATEVVEGVVEVASEGEAIDTSAGFGIATFVGRLGTPETLLPAPGVANAGDVQTSETLTFELLPVDGAQAYRTQLARDAGFLDVIAEQHSEQAGASFDSIGNGRFFVRARAISAGGIEGRSEAFSFRRKRLGVAATAEPSSVDNGFLFAWLPEGEGETLFGFQLWREDAPGALLVDETGLALDGIVVTKLEPGSYSWRVAAIQADEDGLLKVWGPTEKLTISN
ncbi:MAG: FecR domain-containing protein [Sphingomonadaceae bacterium]